MKLKDFLSMFDEHEYFIIQNEDKQEVCYGYTQDIPTSDYHVVPGSVELVISETHLITVK